MPCPSAPGLTETLRWTGVDVAMLPLEGDTLSQAEPPVPIEKVVPMVEEIVTGWLGGAAPPRVWLNVNWAKLADRVGAVAMVSVT